MLLGREFTLNLNCGKCMIRRHTGNSLVTLHFNYTSGIFYVWYYVNFGICITLNHYVITILSSHAYTNIGMHACTHTHKHWLTNINRACASFFFLFFFTMKCYAWLAELTYTENMQECGLLRIPWPQSKSTLEPDSKTRLERRRESEIHIKHDILILNTAEYQCSGLLYSWTCEM